MADKEEIVRDRKLIFCPSTEGWTVPELLRECPDCKTFVLYCCACNNTRRHRLAKPCHHVRIIFTDGACTNNGKPGAKAGIGVAHGSDDRSQLSMPITDTFDDFPIRSNQRAELCAAKAGLEFLAEVYDIKPEKEAEIWIIATDSEYVVKGMTEWLLTWKKNGWRTSKGTTPANLDLFLVLDAAMKTLEAKNVTIGLWHIPRENNKLADRLAKAAAIDGDEASK